MTLGIQDVKLSLQIGYAYTATALVAVRFGKVAVSDSAVYGVVLYRYKNVNEWRLVAAYAMLESIFYKSNEQ